MSRRRPLVLCINDELGRYRPLLERNGYELITASTASEGLSVLSERPVDATILDLEMTGTNRATLVRRFKQIKPHIPALLLVSASDRIRPGKIPADAIVTKSESPARLLRVLDHLLNVRFPFFSRWFGNWKHRVSA